MLANNNSKQEKDLPKRPKTVFWVILLFLCVACVVPELFLSRKGYFGVDGMLGFYALLGLASGVALVLLGNLVGLVLKRRENYYQE
mgnify:CR=1 FL=1